MPLEGQWERQNTPVRRLSRRELRILGSVLIVLIVTTAVVLILALHHGSRETAAGCIDVPVPSTTGGATVHACGRQASTICREQATASGVYARAAQAECRAQKIR